MKLSALLKDCPDLDCELDIIEDDIVSDIVVLARCVKLDEPGSDALVSSAPDSTTFIMQIGMLQAALISMGSPPHE